MKTVILNSTLVNPPHFGQAGDLMQLPDAMADSLIANGGAETPEARKARLAALKAEAEAKKKEKKAAAADDMVLITSGEEEKRVDEHLQGLDQLFEMQADSVGDAEPAPVEKKKK